MSAGLLPYRCTSDLEVFVVHPGGPYWAGKDAGAWSIAKGEYTAGEDPWVVACREFEEEVGQAPPADNPIALGEIRQPSGKRVTVFAVLADAPVSFIASNTFEMEWPPRSGQSGSFPEVDDGRWMTADEAAVKLVKGQRAFLERLAMSLHDGE